MDHGTESGDFEFWVKASLSQSVVFLPPYLGYWRAHGDQQIAYQDEVKFQHDRLNIVLDSLAEESPVLSHPFRMEAQRRFLDQFGRLVLRLILKGRWRLAFDLFQHREVTLARLFKSALNPFRGRAR